MAMKPATDNFTDDYSLSYIPGVTPEDEGIGTRLIDNKWHVEEGGSYQKSDFKKAIAEAEAIAWRKWADDIEAEA